MLNWLKIISPEILIASLIVVVIPTIWTVIVRISLYRHIKDLNQKIRRLLDNKSSGQKSTIVQVLEDRFKAASQVLEHVNTGALIDEIYSQERFPFFNLGLKLRCEQWDYISRLLPNLLLAFGLVGTFGGISFNLYKMSHTLANSNTQQLLSQIQPYLQGMGVAFVTSLIALLCSSCLTIVNLIYNTSVAKYEFLSSLEDYLDNLYKPQVEGNTRLDKAVDRMVKQQEEFLKRFRENVGQVLEETFGKAANRIVEEHAESNRLARQVYESFSQAAGTISSSVYTFQYASAMMQEQALIMKENTGKIQSSVQRLVYFSETIKTSAEIIERSNFSQKLEQITTNLAQTTTYLAQTQATFSNSVNALTTNIEKMAENYRKSIEVSERVHSQLYDYSNNLQSASTDLKEGSQVFLQASQVIKQSEVIEQIASLNHNAKQIIPLGKKIESCQEIISLLGQIMIKTSEKIEQTATNLSQNQGTFSNSVNFLGLNIEQLAGNQKKSMEVSERVQSHLSDCSTNLKKVSTDLKEGLQQAQKVMREGEIIEQLSSLNQIQVINGKFDYLNKRMDDLLVLAKSNYDR